MGHGLRTGLPINVSSCAQGLKYALGRRKVQPGEDGGEVYAGPHAEGGFVDTLVGVGPTSQVEETPQEGNQTWETALVLTCVNQRKEM